MTGAQKQDVKELLSAFDSLHPQNVTVKEVSKIDVIVTFQLDDGPNGLATEYFYGSWKNGEYQWTFQLAGLPTN